MPFGDRRGPLGYGPMTGRGAGYCGGFGMPGYMNRPGWGGGWGRGARGRGRGFRRRYFWGPGVWMGPYNAPVPWWGTHVTKTDELEALRSQADFLKESLSEVQKRIEELEKAKQEEV